MSIGVLDDLSRGIGRLEPLSVDQYHRMIALGILNEDDPLELIDGILVRRDRQDSNNDEMPQGQRHSGVVGQLGELLTLQCVPLGCHPRIQLPLPLPPVDEPEPDLCIVRGRAREYLGRFPERADVLVVVEVADSSLAYDEKTKQRLYAASSLPIYVIVNLQDEAVVVYSQPIREEQRYREQVHYRRGEIVVLNLDELGQVSLSVDDVL